jgi:uncharacterized membrane protein
MAERSLRITLVVLTVVGIAVATYLTYIHYAGIKPLCGRNGGGCEIVQTSEYSKLVGVPVALTVIGFGFSAYLTYRELFSIHHICEWCVSSAVIVTVLMCLATWRFLRGDAATRDPSTHTQGGGPEPSAPLGAAHS